MAEITIEHVSKRFPGGVTAVDDLSLEIEDGEFVCLVGPSGCGKTTLLRMIAGLEDTSEGVIRIGDRDVTGLAPQDRDIAMVFQSYALYPHMTVSQNLGFGLKLRRTPKDVIAGRVGATSRMLGLTDYLRRKPSALSGGQRQRVAMGRAMVREPRAFLMDEPLSNLDAKLRVQMRAEIAQLRSRLATTTVYVTHDQIEAMTLGDRVAVLRDGVLQQLETPRTLYKSPKNAFVAGFIGSPSMNLIHASYADEYVQFGEARIPTERRDLPSRFLLGIRPHAFQDAAFATANGNANFSVIPEVCEDLGGEVHVLFSLPGTSVETSAADAIEDEGEPLFGTSLTAVLRPETQARPGEPLALTLTPESLYFFDVASGLAI